MIEIKVPGKLFISGEYAAIFPENHAIIVPVNRFLSAQIRPVSTSYSTIKSNDQELKIDFNNLSNKNVSKYWLPVKNVITLLHAWFLKEHIRLQNFYLNIESELVDPKLGKIGLGSSGAVTVATIKAILAFEKVELSDLDIFSLAMQVQSDDFNNSSYGDLAVATFQKPIYYQKPNSLSNLNPIQTFKWPKEWYFLTGFTGEPFQTKIGVKKFYQLPQKYQRHFCKRIDKLTTDFYLALIKHDYPIDIFRKISNLYWDLDQSQQIGIFTPSLKKLVNVAKSLQIPAKQSGAGGGDCGIAITNSQQREQLLNKWEEEGIIPLNLEVIN